MKKDRKFAKGLDYEDRTIALEEAISSLEGSLTDLYSCDSDDAADAVPGVESALDTLRAALEFVSEQAEEESRVEMATMNRQYEHSVVAFGY